MSNILSRKTRPLLRTVGGYPRAEYDKSTADDIKDSPAEASLKPGKKQSVHRIKKNVDPISDDKPSDTGFRRLSPEIEDSDGSGGGRPDRGSIKSTNFVSSKEASNGRQQSGQGKPPKETTWAQNSNGSKRRKLVDDAEAADRKTTTPSSSQRSSSSKSGKTPTSSGEHMTTAMGFVKKPKVVQAYGAGSKGSAKRTSGSQEKRLTVFQSKNGAGDTNNLVNARDSPASKFVVFHSENEEESQEEAGHGFRKPKETPDSSPSKDSEAKFKATKDEESDASSATPRAKPKARLSRQASTKSKPKKKQSKRKGQSAEEEPKESSPVFQTYSDDFDLSTPVKNRDRPGSPLSELGSIDDHAPVKPVDVETTAVPSVTSCPWCGEPVDDQLLMEFSRGKRMNVRQQTRFCQKHRKQTAQETWKTKSYPTINWEQLPDRIATHYDSLLDIINGSKPSHYRAKLAEKIQAGQDRTMKKEENLNPGYYGPRGFNLMCDHLVDRFGDLLKQKAVHDRVISGRGSAAFIQSVLVAELAVGLIKEDIDVDVEQAREIMEESKAIGQMIHEEA